MVQNVKTILRGLAQQLSADQILGDAASRARSIGLQEASQRHPDTPMPLFLATEWLLDAGQTERARQQFQRALQLAAGTREDYSGLSDPIKQRFSALTK